MPKSVVYDVSMPYVIQMHYAERWGDGKPYFGQELSESASWSTITGIQHLLGLKCLGGDKKLDGIFPAVKVVPRYLHHRLPCTPSTNQVRLSGVANQTFEPEATTPVHIIRGGEKS
jgi:hypothetical protein